MSSESGGTSKEASVAPELAVDNNSTSKTATETTSEETAAPKIEDTKIAKSDSKMGSGTLRKDQPVAGLAPATRPDVESPNKKKRTLEEAKTPPSQSAESRNKPSNKAASSISSSSRSSDKHVTAKKKQEENNQPPPSKRPREEPTSPKKPPSAAAKSSPSKKTPSTEQKKIPPAASKSDEPTALLNDNQRKPAPVKVASSEEQTQQESPEEQGEGEEQEPLATVVSYLLEEGHLGPDGELVPTTLSMTLTNTDGREQKIRLQVGDDVVLLQDDEDDDRKWPPARIQGFVERDDGVFFSAQWFLSREDIETLPRIPWTGVLTRSELLGQMQENEIVLSNSTDENEIGAICGLARVIYNRQDGNEAPSSRASPLYQCRYQLDVSSTEMKLMPYTGGRDMNDDAEDDASVSTTNDDESSKRGSASSSHKKAAMDVDDEDSDSVGAPAVVATEGEGSTLRESIEVGPEHQAVVPKWNPRAKPKIRSRNPKLIWKPGRFNDEQVGEFLEGVATHHTPFLEKNRLTSTASYTPVLGVEKLDKLLQHRPERLTGSSLSTASMLAGEDRRAKLRKECDVDTLLEILADSKGSVERAIETAALDLDRITRAWTFSEKSLYNDGFRRHQGILRKIAKSVAPVKSMQDVVDYHFRFKIPDKFRQYQEKKREIAVRMVECMEEKRAFVPPTNLSASLEEEQAPNAVEEGQDSAPPHWSETSTQEVATLTDLRRRRARQLMVNVHEELGPEVLAQVAHCIRELTAPNPSSDARKNLLTALSEHSELQQRFIDFLP